MRRSVSRISVSVHGTLSLLDPTHTYTRTASLPVLHTRGGVRGDGGGFLAYIWQGGLVGWQGLLEAEMTEKFVPPTSALIRDWRGRGRVGAERGRNTNLRDFRSSKISQKFASVNGDLPNKNLPPLRKKSPPAPNDHVSGVGTLKFVSTVRHRNRNRTRSVNGRRGCRLRTRPRS